MKTLRFITLTTILLLTMAFFTGCSNTDNTTSPSSTNSSTSSSEASTAASDGIMDETLDDMTE